MYDSKPKVKLELVKYIRQDFHVPGKYHPVSTPRIGYLLIAPAIGTSFLMADLDSDSTNKGMGTSPVTDVWKESEGVTFFRTMNSVYRMTFVE